MKSYYIALMLIVATAGTALSESSLVDDGNTFAVELYGRLATTEGNLFFSPMSIHAALTMVYAGARNRTEAQMAEVLHFKKNGIKLHREFADLVESLDSPRMVVSYEMADHQFRKIKKPAYQLVIANALWGQKGYSWKQDFLSLTAACYGAGLYEVDFAGHTEAARDTINAWVEKQTHDRIKELIAKGSLNILTRLVLTNAIYFKANWAQEFSDSLTEDQPFNVTLTKQVILPMMFRKGNFRYMETDTFQALDMPYKGRELSMIVFLPKKTDGLGAFERGLTSECLSAWLERFDDKEVAVSFPRFTFQSGFALANILETMGMKDAFSPTLADFSGMTTATNEDVYVSNVIHKAFVAVDEKGTEAAAATAAIMATRAMPRPGSKIFRADHPFLFMIRHNSTGIMLFMGKVVNPESAQGRHLDKLS
jgi:serpin B